ncbi:cyclic dof factor 1-like [Canna indica]|uniref:Cyclic dof factor 1-like n=1 Tax=Canna indica TaxID=4628 RepID=A0AAQ3K2Y2_9LILI|nr:cyclic dof factor 1-like [Canna indica]
MAEEGDTAIKLFGKTIPLRVISRDDEKNMNLESEDGQKENESSATSTSVNQTPPSATQDDEDGESKSSISKEQTDQKKEEENLPCPRCKSAATKFCYYNNYNVNQPRHFCKNCQRYWTAGGAMRNVPVGAGRRKNKHAPRCRHVTISDSSAHTAANEPLLYPASSTPSVFPAEAYWSCGVPPGAWSFPWLLPSTAAASVLGKHSRDGNTTKEDDPEEAAKSSMCAMVNGRRGLFRAFHAEGEMKNHGLGELLLLHANPAAISRSINFQESSYRREV